ncbi:hypothetical protein [Acuticoccus kandeliae]|uniref:hypothetical protein n=1 Tax=Acuticoccus kandeliae TaxID=2073160 RepID=UPI001300A364|nr:hypothetical protein [Acuticoccus kandeliae]
MTKGEIQPAARPGDGAFVAAQIAEIRHHPALPAAIDAFFLSMTEHQKAQRVRRFVIGDRGRRLAFWAALYLDAESRQQLGPGLTVNRLCDVLQAHGDMSRGRARAIFHLLRHVGFIERAGPSEAGKHQAFRPSERMLRMATDRLALFFRALAEVSPVGRSALAALQTDGFCALFFARVGKLIVDGIRPLDREPLLAEFVSRDGGEYVLMHLCLAHSRADPVARRKGIVFNITEIARATHTSRPQVSRIIAAAAEAGLVARPSRAEIVVAEPLLAAVNDAIAATFTDLAAITEVVLADLPALSPAR